MINASQTKINHTLASVSCLLIVCPLQLVSHVYVLVSFFFLLSRIPRDWPAATANSHKVCSDVIDKSHDTQVGQLK